MKCYVENERSFGGDIYATTICVSTLNARRFAELFEQMYWRASLVGALCKLRVILGQLCGASALRLLVPRGRISLCVELSSSSCSSVYELAGRFYIYFIDKVGLRDSSFVNVFTQ